MTAINKDHVVSAICDYIKVGNPTLAELDAIPLTESLVELGYMDSFGIVDVVEFLESTYDVTVEDDEITKENFGSVEKMAAFLLSKRH